VNGWRVSRREFLKASAGLFAGGILHAASAPLRFGVVTDVHYADRSPAGSRFYRLGMSKLRACVDLMNSQGVDFLIELGDFKDQDVKPDEAGTLRFLGSIEEVFRGFRGPKYHVLGNHDVDSITKEQFQSVIVNTGIERSRTWYSFERGGRCFIVLDACFKADMTPYSKGNFDWQDTNISPEQVDWLAKELRGAPRPVVACVHQRLDESASEPSIANRAAVRQVLKDSGKVTLVLQGHVHSGAYEQIESIHYYTLAASIEGDNPTDNTCSIVQLNPDGGVEITGYQRAASRRAPPRAPSFG
jgi:predicted phosphodiesterase